MSRYFTNADNANLIYFQFPKILMYGEKYKKMSSDAKLLYMLTLDLIKLSMKKGWKDEHGHYYIKMSLETIQERMNCGKEKAVKLKKELAKYKLLEEKRVGLGKANRLYILQLEYSDNDIYRANNDHEGIENDEEMNLKNKTINISKEPKGLDNQQKYEKQTSRSTKNKLQEVRKSNTIKNEFINNNSIKNENLNPNLDIYEILWNTKIPMELKTRIKVKIANKSISLSPEQILDIENAYHYQIEKMYVDPNCAYDDIHAINDLEFSNTVTKMLETVKNINNMKGLIKEWVQLALEHKKEWHSVSDYSHSGAKLYNWLEQ